MLVYIHGMYPYINLVQQLREMKIFNEIIMIIGKEMPELKLFFIHLFITFWPKHKK